MAPSPTPPRAGSSPRRNVVRLGCRPARSTSLARVALFAGVVLCLTPALLRAQPAAPTLFGLPDRPNDPSRLPVTGGLVPELVAYDNAMLQFMRDRGIQAATLAVVRNGVIILEHGYGWQDRARTTPVSPAAWLRTGSNDKPITSAMLKRLVSKGQLNPAEPVFPYLGITAPHGRTQDPRVNTITVQQMIDHKAGWDAAQSGFDAGWESVRIAAALGVPSPADARDTGRYMAGQPLQFSPGERTAYCNFCYDLLRLVVEGASGLSFVGYAQQELGLDLGRSYAFAADRSPRELWYADPYTCTNVYAPAGPPVPCADGGWAVTSLRLAMSSAALGEFLNRFWINGDPRSPGQRGFDYTFFGSVPGTYTVTRQRGDGVFYAAMFNQREDPSKLAYDAITAVLDAATAAVTTWPACAFTVSPVAVSMPASGGTATVTITGTSGCAWTAAGQATFVTVPGTQSGRGNGSITVAAATNTGAARLGNVTVAGRTVAVVQAGAAPRLATGSGRIR